MLLNKIHSPDDIKNFSQKEIAALAEEVRSVIIKTVSQNGGHLASNLGVVELTIALHRVFNSPSDAIIWDVSHQSYTHKLLTGRYAQFSTLRKAGGLSGFTKHAESPHDYFDNGHASTAISQALGLATGRAILNPANKDYVVAVIGDGALTGGLPWEALMNAGQSPYSRNLIIIVNDNQMSIDHNVGALGSYLSRLTMTTHYQAIRRAIDWIVKSLPFVGKTMSKYVFRFKRGLKGLLFSNNLFSDLDFEYVGPLDGHDEKCMERILRRVKKMHKCTVVHVITKKGKGYDPAETEPEKFHGIGPFCITDGSVEKFDTISFTQRFNSALMDIAARRSDIVCITAAMAKGTGLDTFARHYPARFFDVGIAEEHAITFAGGLSRAGMIPIVCIYSTFLQRAVDEIIHDVALQNLHVVIVLDRSGAVPYDGETHQGLFDISLFKSVPKVTILSPATGADLSICLNWAVDKASNPVLIRYPKATCPTEIPLPKEDHQLLLQSSPSESSGVDAKKEDKASIFSVPIEMGRGVLIRAEDFCPTLAVSCEPCHNDGVLAEKVLYVTTGGMLREVLVACRALLLRNVISDIYTLRFIKPIDESYFLAIAKRYTKVVFVEDNVVTGGIGEYLSLVCGRAGYTNFVIKAFPDDFFAQGSREAILEAARMSPSYLVEAAKKSDL